MMATRWGPSVGSCCSHIADRGSNWFLVLILSVVSFGTISVLAEQSTTSPLAPDIKVRLLEGPDIHEGILEYFHPQEQGWIPVCGDAIQKEDANVVCRELGFHGADVITNVTRFTDGLNYTALPNVWCERNDEEVYTILSNCILSGVSEGHPCDQKAPQITCLTTRLVGGGDASSGRVEVWSESRGWGKVCSPEFSEKEQSVTCRELGYTNRSERAYSSLQYQDSGRPYEWEDVVCTGSETKLADCTVDRTAVGSCPENADAFAACTSETSAPGTPPFLAVRLEDGPCPMEGRLEVFDGQDWGTVCQEEITENDAMVVCRQLGYEHESAEVVRCCDTYPAARLGASDVFGVLNCTGDEQMIGQCPHPKPGSREGCTTIRSVNHVGIRCNTCPHVRKANMKAVIGGVIGVVVLVIVVIAVLWYVCYIPKSKYQKTAEEHDDYQDDIEAHHDDDDDDIETNHDEKPMEEPAMVENDLTNANGNVKDPVVNEELDEIDLQERTITTEDSFV